LLQGTTISYVAKLLHVAVPAKAKRRIGFDFELTDNIKSEMQEVILTEDSKAVGKRIVELNIPATVNVLAIQRNGVFIAPIGSTKLMANDRLHVLAEDMQSIEQLSRSLDLKF
ncbi:MAG TPA: TrkA C-terminal domain-containing protein, partial [Flavisolibacter sp.]|nr:TrkA C-terminal domain-containing protein [Flavisolibacter sp.]